MVANKYIRASSLDSGTREASHEVMSPPNTLPKWNSPVA